MKPMRVSLVLWAGQHEGDWEREGPNSIYLWEPLDAKKVPEDAVPSVGMGNTVNFYAPGGNRVLARDVPYSHLVEVGQECCLLTDVGWFSVASCQVVWREGCGWNMRWWAFNNTRWARALNAAMNFMKLEAKRAEA
jgi:hypothetical protein